MSYPHPRAAHGPSLNRNASERSSMKNPEHLGRFAEIARVLVGFDDVACIIVNADHGIM